MRTWVVIAILAAALLAALLLGRPPERPPAVPPTAIDDPTTTTTVTTIRDCSGQLTDATRANSGSVDALAWTPFGAPERGWRTYAPLVAREIGVDCGPETPAFAVALANWERNNGLLSDGLFDAAAFDRMRLNMHRRRPYVALRGRGVCPDPPPADQLATALPAEGYRGTVARMRPQVLTAYRRMVAAARAEDPAIAADPEALTVFSAYRDPARDAARCLTEGNCDGRRRARCSPHRTGLALDLTVGAAPGGRVDSTADFNRLAQSRTPAYRWLVRNAGRFGFVNYPYEPWHWEWTGEAP